MITTTKQEYQVPDVLTAPLCRKVRTFSHYSQFDPDIKIYETSTQTAVGSYLSGKVTQALLPNNSTVALRHNVFLGMRTLKMVQGLEIHSENFPGRTNQAGASIKKVNALQESLAMFSNRYNEYVVQFFKRIMALVIKEGAGNCHELAIVAYAIAQELNNEFSIKTPISVADIWNGDHVFLILGEKEDQVVCDPWANTCFPLTLWKDYLMNFIGTASVLEEDKKVPEVSPLDPHMHIRVRTNILTVY